MKSKIIKLKKNKSCKHIPIIENVTDFLPGGWVFQTSKEGNVCSKCGELL